MFTNDDTSLCVFTLSGHGCQSVAKKGSGRKIIAPNGPTMVVSVKTHPDKKSRKSAHKVAAFFGTTARDILLLNV
jgi:hypothetical protein